MPLGEPEKHNPLTLTPYHRNPRRGNIKAIAASLRTNGQYKPIVVNRGTRTGRPMEVLAGNHTLKAALELQSQGVPGFDSIDCWMVDVDDDTAVRIVLADNRTSDLGTYDDDELAALLEDVREDLSGTGYDEEDVASLLDSAEDSEPYTRDVKIPLYEPTMIAAPAVSTIVDRSKTEELEEQIRAAGIDEDTEWFLLQAAQRHTVIDFHLAAEFYAHAGPEVQRLMEEQALVIIDMDDAIRGGYVRLREDLEAERLAEEGEE